MLILKTLAYFGGWEVAKQFMVMGSADTRAMEFIYDAIHAKLVKDGLIAAYTRTMSKATANRIIEQLIALKKASSGTDRSNTDEASKILNETIQRLKANIQMQPAGLSEKLPADEYIDATIVPDSELEKTADNTAPTAENKAVGAGQEATRGAVK